jgi:asparagine synthase (glutamine-hydrolysing)
MSGIAGIFNLDGRPADSRILRRMLEVIAHRGPNGIGQHTDGAIGLGSAVLHSTAGSRGETQPVYDDPSGLAITLDGRIDNRDELKSELRATLRTDTDAELVLGAYQRWGEESPRHILGDFAYVIRDSNARRLFCARDHLGLRPFYYFTDGRVFLWASEPRALFEHPAVPKRPNEGMVAEHLAGQITSLEETLYQGILRLPRAHFLVVEPRGLRKKRYWDIDLSHQVRYKTDREYADHFSHTFKEAVRCRMCSQGPVAAELSGGIDSSCIVGMCQSLFHDGSVPNLGFETLSLVFPDLPCDETSYLRQMVAFWNLSSNEVPVLPDAEWYSECASRYLDLPDHPNCHMSDFPAALAQRKGFRVILTGLGGDDWFDPLVQQSRTRRALRRLCAQPSPATVGSLLGDGVNMLRRRLGKPSDHPAPWIPDAFASRTCLADRIRRQPPDGLFASPVQKKLYVRLTNATLSHFLEMKERASARAGMEHRHPFHDRRLIELALALPPDQLRRGDQPKFVLRQAMKGLVPDAILQRRTKAEFSAVFAQVYESDKMAPLFHSSRIAEQGWIDQARVTAMYREFMQTWNQGQKDFLPHGWPLGMFLGIELWFRAAFPNGCRG